MALRALCLSFLLAVPAMARAQEDFSPVEEARLPARQGAPHLAISPDGKLLATACSQDGTIEIWDLSSRLKIRSIQAFKVNGWDLAFSPDGRLLAAEGDGGDYNRMKFKVWDTSKWKDWDLSGKFTGFSFSPDSSRIALRSGDDIWLVQAASGRKKRVWHGPAKRRATGSAFQPYDDESVTYAGFVGGGKKLLVDRHAFGWGDNLFLLDPDTGKTEPLDSPQPYNAWHAALSPDAKLLAVAGNYPYIGLFSVEERAWRAPIPIQGTYGGELRFSPDGAFLLAAEPDGGIRGVVLDPVSGRTLWRGPAQAFNDLLLSPDGRLLIGWSNGGIVLYRTQLVPHPKAPPALSVKLDFTEPSGNKALDADETATVRVEVSNSGPGPAYGVSIVPALAAPVNGVSFPDRIEVGRIDPRQSVVKEIPVHASQALPSGKAELRIDVKEGNGFDADAKAVVFQTQAFKAPRLELAEVRLGGAGVVKAGEPTLVSILVWNSGEGPIRGATARLVLDSPDIFASGDVSAGLGDIKPGGSAKAEFEFFVNKRFKGPALPVAVSITEAEGRFGLPARSLGLVLGETAPRLEVTTVQAKEAPKAPVPEARSEDVDSPPAAEASPDPEAYAVVVGVERYRQAGLPVVEFAARDAQAVHSYLTRAMGFDPKNVVLLQNEQATKTDLEKYLGPWLQNRVSEKSRVFVYYAGHGVPNPTTGEGYILPYEGDPSYTDITAYPLKRLFETLAQLPAKDVTVVLDSCFSGQGQRSVMAKGARPLVLTAAAEPAGENTTVITAASGEQISSSFPEGRHGLLTYYLLKGLRGAADANKDGRITSSEVYAYLKPLVEREARKQNVEQTPTFKGRPDGVWLKLR